jgi:hypothetical protein
LNPGRDATERASEREAGRRIGESRRRASGSTASNREGSSRPASCSSHTFTRRIEIDPDGVLHRLERCPNDKNAPVRDPGALVVDEASHGRRSAGFATMLLRPSGAHAA